MKTDQRKKHWDTIYRVKSDLQMSWTQEIPKSSLQLIESLQLPKNSSIIDIGGGNSRLVNNLYQKKYTTLSVLDISKEALAKTKNRFGVNADQINWIEADITTFQPNQHYDLWHDRATFHFLTEESDIQSYVQLVNKFVQQHLIIGTFSTKGPTKCSSLPILQYSKETLKNTFKECFKLHHSISEIHTTHTGKNQHFIFNVFSRK